MHLTQTHEYTFQDRGEYHVNFSDFYGCNLYWQFFIRPESVTMKNIIGSEIYQSGAFFNVKIDSENRNFVIFALKIRPCNFYLHKNPALTH